MVADDWVNYKLGDICEFTQGVQIPYSEQKQEETDGYIRYLYIRDFFSDKDMCFIKDEYPHKIMSKTDIMMVNTGNTAGKVYSGAEGVLSNNAFKFDFDRNILDRDFLFQFLTSHILEKYIKQLFNTAGQPHIGHKNVALVPLQLPPLKEQEKIADILSTTDDKIDAIAIQIEKAEILKKGLLQKLLSEGIGHSEFKDSELGKIPESWELTTIGKSSKNFDGQRVPLKSEDRQSIQGEYPYYGAQGIIDYVNDYIFDGRYLLVAEDGENVKGQKYDIAFVVSGKFWVNNHAHILQANDNMDLYFISSILNHINIIKYVTGTGQPKLNKAQLNSIKIPLPPLEEQKQIADILSSSDEKLDVLRVKKEKYETLKKGLLQKLLSGEVRV